MTFTDFCKITGGEGAQIRTLVSNFTIVALEMWA